MIQCNESSTSSENTNGSRRNQSPINIDKLKAIPKIYPPILMSGHAEATTKMTMMNTGHTVEIRPSVDGPGAFLSGGPLKEKYKFLQLHFHWGSTNAVGSEHSINGNFYSMEAHFVHYTEKYQTIENSSSKSDGLAVVAVFFQMSSEDDHEDHTAITRITNHLASARTVGTPVDIPPEVLAWVKDYCFCCGQYYTYNGSLTTPPFTENVIWLIYPIPVEVSKRHIDLFRQLDKSTGGKITSNRRQTQLLGERQVYVVENTLRLRNEDEDQEGGTSRIDRE